MRLVLATATLWMANVVAAQEINLRGTVTSDDGTPTADVTLWLDAATWDRRDEQLLQATTDEDGDFSLAIPDELIANLHGNPLLYIYKPGFRIKTQLIGRALNSEMVSHEIALQPAEGVSTRVVDADGDPVEGVLVCPQTVQEPFGNGKNVVAMPLPSRVMDRLQVTTDESGLARFDFIDQKCHYSYRLSGEEIGTQIHQLKYQRPEEIDDTDAAEVVVLPVSATGQFSFEFEIDESETPGFDELNLCWSSLSYTGGEARTSAAPFSQQVSVDDTTTIDNLAFGLYKVHIIGLHESEWVADFPNMFRVSQHQPDHYVIPLRKGVEFQTRLVDEDTGEPIANTRVTLMFGKAMQMVTVMSDDQGRVVAGVLPGLLWLRVPYDYQRSIPTKRTVFHKYQIPEEEKFVADDVPVPTK